MSTAADNDKDDQALSAHEDDVDVEVEEDDEVDVDDDVVSRENSLTPEPDRHFYGDDNEEEEEEDDEEEDDDDDNGLGGGDDDGNDDDDDDDDDEDDDDGEDDDPPLTVVPPQPRGKPEAMARALASAVRKQEELEAAGKEIEEEDDDDDDDDGDIDTDVVMTQSIPMDTLATLAASMPSATTPSITVPTAVKKNKTAHAGPATGGSKKRKVGDMTLEIAAAHPANKAGLTSTPKKKKSVLGASNTPSSAGGGGGSSSANRSTSKSRPSEGSSTKSLALVPTMDDPVAPITETEYEKLEAVMVQFCRVPLLAEFSRPVSLLHPELMNVYSKIVEHPIDLGKVCRRIRRRQYRNLRDVRLDAWRIFANCVKYHSHPSNKEAVPSFVSIALHLREYFNDLWQEHMLPSDFPPPVLTASGKVAAPSKSNPSTAIRAAMEQRVKDRKKRLIVSGLSVMAGRSLERAADALSKLIENGGCVDRLDVQPIWGEGVSLDDDDEGDLDVVLENLRKLEQTLRDTMSRNEELGVDELEASVRKCYTEGDGLENMSTSLRIRIASRLDRFMGQLVVPIHEATCRGVSQSSTWGCMAAAVWARESSKKPFWPALVLGIIAPEDQREDWHNALTERNEARLPEKLKTQLITGKRKAEQAIKRQISGQADPQSFFLVEFLGTHEFIWVREADIVENFIPDQDPNKGDGIGNKKKRLSRSNLTNILGSKTYANAIEEGQWALEEFELQLQDIGGDGEVEDDDGHEEGYSYSVLSQSDDEAEDGDADEDDLANDSMDLDELNELLATNGLLDFSMAGRKKRALILKQQKVDAERKQKAMKLKKAKADKAKKMVDAKTKEKEKKQEQRDVEKRRRARMRQREKALKGVQHQIKQRKLSDPAPGRRHVIVGKRERAQAIIDGYVNRASKREEYKSLCLGSGVMTIPAAVIDSTGLVGMALAFRAAAGEIPMPEESGDRHANRKPWDAIRLKGKKTSAERTACLQQQIALLEKEIKKAKANKERRVKLLKETEAALERQNKRISTDDMLARENPLKKLKKPQPQAEKKAKTLLDKPNDEGADLADLDVGEDPDESIEVDAVESNDFEDTPNNLAVEG